MIRAFIALLLLLSQVASAGSYWTLPDELRGVMTINQPTDTNVDIYLKENGTTKWNIRNFYTGDDFVLLPNSGTDVLRLSQLGEFTVRNFDGSSDSTAFNVSQSNVNLNRDTVVLTGKTLKITDVTASRALTTSASSVVTASSTTATQLGYLSGATGTTGTTTTNLVFSASPTFTTQITTPQIAFPSAGVLTKTGTGTLTLASGADSSTITKSGTGGLTLATGANAVSLTWGAASTLTMPTGTVTVASLSNKISDFASSTSAELAGKISDETGSGALVFGTSPTFTTSISTPKVVFPSAGELTKTGTGTLTLASGADSSTLTKTGTGNLTLTSGANNYTLTVPATGTVALLGTAQTFTAAQTFRAANAIRSEAASTQDAVVIAGRAGGTNSYAVTITPTTLSASRTLTLANGNTTLVTGTMAPTASPTFTTQIIAPIVYGSSSASGSLTLDSTSNATKGDIYFGASGALGSVSNAGAWTWGGATNSPYNSFHTTNKSIFTSTPGAVADSNGALFIGANHYAAAGWQPTRITNLGGVALLINPRTSDTEAAFTVRMNKKADAADTASIDVASATQAGAWTIGPSGVNNTHTVHGKLSTTTTSTSCATGTNTAVLTLSGLNDGFYFVSTSVTGYNSSQVGYVGILAKLPSTSEWTLTNLKTGSAITVTENDASLIVNQTTGVTVTVNLSVLRFG
jgi:hypothetical protein